MWPALASASLCRDGAFFFADKRTFASRLPGFPSLVNLERKIRIVVIVNAGGTVDNRDFFHMLKGLRAVLPVGQTLRLDRTDTGQKIGRHKTQQFRTFDPVDIQQLIHKASVDPVLFQWVEVDVVDVATASGCERVRSRTFFSRTLAGRSRVETVEVDGVFRQGRSVRNESPGLQPKACIQNDDSS